MRRLLVAVLLAALTVVASARTAGAHDCPPGWHEDTVLLGVCHPDQEEPSTTVSTTTPTTATSTSPSSTTSTSSSPSTAIGVPSSPPSVTPSTPSSGTPPDGEACTTEDCGPWTTSAPTTSMPTPTTSTGTGPTRVSAPRRPPSSQLSTLPATGPDDPAAIAVAAIGAIAAGALLVLVFGRRR